IDPQVLEIQRQNLITQKILQRYLERRLHPGRKPQIRVPSEQDYGDDDDEEEEEGGGDYREGRLDLDQYDEDDELDAVRFDIESLQSGESEHVDSFYRDKHYHRQRGNYHAERPIPCILPARTHFRPVLLGCIPSCSIPFLCMTRAS
uniref:Uncharacterized protein n=1 Tax=Anopheles atroparvus TaxID=41427 RepID=A0A182J4F8_ANOAO